MKKVSVIIPVYNTEKYLKKCIDSVLNQSYKDIELVIVNDDSPDNSDAIIKGYDDNRIKYYKRSNHGIGATRNFGLDKCSGDYIVFLDSDDYLTDLSTIKVMVDRMGKDNLDILVSDYIEDFYGNKIKTKNVSFPNTCLESSPYLINELNLGPSNKMYTKDIIGEDRFPENVKYEDFALVLKLFDKANKIGKIDEYLFTFNKLDNGQTKVVDKKVYDIFKSLDEVIYHFKGRYKSNIDELVVKMCLLYATQQKRQLVKEERNKFIDEAYRYLIKNVDDYKHNNYFNKCSFIKKIIQKNKLLLKIYCNL